MPENAVSRMARPLILLAICALNPLATLSAQQYPETSYQEMRWRMIGPFRGGRTRAVAGIAGRPNVFYIGVVNGGVWKSDDYGRTWRPIFDNQPTQSIGAIAVTPSNPDILYVASGEGLQRPDLSVGDGIYKSTDAGKTWTHSRTSRWAADPRAGGRSARSQPHLCGSARTSLRAERGARHLPLHRWRHHLGQGAYTRTKTPAALTSKSIPPILMTVYASLWQSRLGPWEDR